MTSDENNLRRSHPRLPHVAGVRIRRAEGDDAPADDEIYASLVDVSPEGAHLLGGREIPPGQLVELVLHEEILGEPMSVHGVIRWCRGDGEDEIYSLGVKIDDADLPLWHEVIVQVV